MFLILHIPYIATGMAERLRGRVISVVRAAPLGSSELLLESLTSPVKCCFSQPVASATIDDSSCSLGVLRPKIWKNLIEC